MRFLEEHAHSVPLFLGDDLLVLRTGKYIEDEPIDLRPTVLRPVDPLRFRSPLLPSRERQPACSRVWQQIRRRRVAFRPSPALDGPHRRVSATAQPPEAAPGVRNAGLMLRTRGLGAVRHCQETQVDARISDECKLRASTSTIPRHRPRSSPASERLKTCHSCGYRGAHAVHPATVQLVGAAIDFTSRLRRSS